MDKVSRERRTFESSSVDMMCGVAFDVRVVAQMATESQSHDAEATAGTSACL